MAPKDQKPNIYAECNHIKRALPDFELNEQIAKDIGSNYRTLPVFEQGLYNNVLTRHYSLERNELLKCRWKEYKRHIEGRVFEPFQFPEIGDLHFHNGAVRFLPSESVHRHEHRMKLKPGPGVDIRGQMPIPEELMMKRGKLEREKENKIKTSKKGSPT